MDKTEFNIAKTNFFGSQGYSLILEREKTIIILVQLFIALLVIASFSEKIIPPTAIPLMKIIIVFLLLLIPILIWDYVLKINDGINSITSVLFRKQEKEKWYLTPFKLSTYYYITILTVIVDVVCKIIIDNIILFLIACTIQVTIIALIILSKRYLNKGYSSL